jgi:hypothetical protein
MDVAGGVGGRGVGVERLEHASAKKNKQKHHHIIYSTHHAMNRIVCIAQEEYNVI